jgi:hypothetical protein
VLLSEVTRVRRLSFAQIEAVLMVMHDIAVEKRVAFVGRLKNLQKLELLGEAGRPGRGAVGSYGYSDLVKFVVAVELLRAGLPPQLATSVVRNNWGSMYGSLHYHTQNPVWRLDEEFARNGDTETEKALEDYETYVWLLEPDALADLRQNNEDKDKAPRLVSSRLEDLDVRLWLGLTQKPDHYARRVVMLHATRLINELTRVLYNLGFMTTEDAIEDLESIDVLLEAFLNEDPDLDPVAARAALEARISPASDEKRANSAMSDSVMQEFKDLRKDPMFRALLRVGFEYP